MRGKKPVAKIVAIAEPPSKVRGIAGSYRGRIHWDKDAFDPMTDEELVQTGLGYMLDAPLLPSPAKPSDQ